MVSANGMLIKKAFGEEEEPITLIPSFLRVRSRFSLASMGKMGKKNEISGPDLVFISIVKVVDLLLVHTSLPASLSTNTLLEDISKDMPSGSWILAWM